MPRSVTEPVRSSTAKVIAMVAIPLPSTEIVRPDSRAANGRCRRTSRTLTGRPGGTWRRGSSSSITNIATVALMCTAPSERRGLAARCSRVIASVDLVDGRGPVVRVDPQLGVGAALPGGRGAIERLRRTSSSAISWKNVARSPAFDAVDPGTSTSYWYRLARPPRIVSSPASTT